MRYRILLLALSYVLSGSGPAAAQRGRSADGRTMILKIRYFDIQPNHFRWTADQSSDGGRTWVREYLRIEATRRVAKPASP